MSCEMTESKFWRGSGKNAASRSKTDEFVQSTDEEGISERFVTRRLHKVAFESKHRGINKKCNKG